MLVPVPVAARSKATHTHTHTHTYIYIYIYIYIYMGVQLNSALQHTGTWSAQYGLPAACYRPAVLSFTVSPVRFHSHTEKFDALKKTLFKHFNFLIQTASFWNCVSRGECVQNSSRKTNVLLLSLKHIIRKPKRGVQYSTVQYSTAQHSTAQYSTVQYSTVQ